MRKVTIVLSIALIVGSIFAARMIIDSKEGRKPRAQKAQKTAFIKPAKNEDIPVTIVESGRLVAKNKMDLFSEVQGVMEVTSKEFKPGATYKKGQTLVKVRNTDYYANLQAQKSVLQNLITSILPDLRMDYPEAYPKWDQYLKNFEMEGSISELPTPTSEKEKFFITGKNIYTTYYNTKNLELVYQKYNIKAPFDGVLTETTVNPGTVIRPGQRLGEFIDPSVYELQVSVSQKVITSIQVGTQVEVVQPDNVEKSWTGRIIRINGKVDPTTQTVQAFVELRGNELKEGMFLEARIPGRKKENAIEINRQLLVNQNQVFVVADSILQLVPIEVLHKTQRTVIVRGVEDGRDLVQRTIPGAYEGMKVVPVTE